MESTQHNPEVGQQIDFSSTVDFERNVIEVAGCDLVSLTCAIDEQKLEAWSFIDAAKDAIFVAETRISRLQAAIRRVEAVAVSNNFKLG